MARGEVEQANRLFDRALRSDRDDLRALLGSARAKLRAGDGEGAVERFTAYRTNGGAWRRAEHFDHCEALRLAAEQLLEAGERPERAGDLVQELAAHECEDAPSGAIALRSGLQLADRARLAGRDADALARYVSLVEAHASRGQGDVPGSGAGGTARFDDPHLARAYLEASRLLLASGRRDEALALLSQGLDELPGNRDLVHLMVTVLAEGSNVVFPREKPPGSQLPAAPR